MRAKSDNVAGKSSVRRKAAPRGPEAPAWVLVGTYKDGQLEAWPGFYNYPLKDDDEIGEEDGRKIGELWLFRGTQDQRTFDAEFVGVKTRDELVADYAYPAKGKPHGSRYLLFKTVEKPNRGYLHGPKVICRLRDFKMSPLWRKRLKAWLADRDGDGAEFAKFIPEAVAAVPKDALFVCETALQLSLFEGYGARTRQMSRRGRLNLTSRSCRGMAIPLHWPAELLE